MNLTETVLLMLASEGEDPESGVVEGRTLLQKRMYFYGVLAGQDFRFRPHYYGPYSSLVSAELDALVAAGLVEDSPSAVDLLGELVRHDYKLKSQEALHDWSSEDEAETAAALFKWIASHPVAQSVTSLSAAAKVHFILSSADSMTSEEVQAKAKDLGWQLDELQIRQVAEYLEYLGLVEVHTGETKS